MKFLWIVLTFTACCPVLPSLCQGSSGFLLFTDSDQGFIYMANSKRYGLLSSPKVIIHSSFSPEAVTYDSTEKRVYWSDTFTNTISRAFLNGSSEEVVVRYVKAVAIAVDSAGRNVYWANKGKGRIEVAKLDGTHRKVLVRTTRPIDMVLDARKRQMYWLSNADYTTYTTVIERASMDGSDRRVIVPGLPYTRPTGLCLDSVNRVLYWTERNTQEIFYVSLDNPSGHHNFFQTSWLSKPFKLTILEQRIYWTDRGNSYFNYYGKVASVNITTKKDLKVLANNVHRPKGIYAFTGHDSTIPDTNCSQNNGGCNHLCLLTPRGDVCACSSGMTLKDDGKTCYYKEFLLVVDDGRKKIFHKSLDDLSRPKTPLALGRTGRIVTVDFDPQEHKIYWTNNRGVIWRAFLNGSSIEKIVDSHNPCGHEIDVIGRNIYWFDLNCEIGVSRLDGSYQKILITLHDQPVAMVLDSSKGLIYWATSAKIERAQMDGQNREVLLQFPSRFYPIYSVRALALDPDNNRLYWVDDHRGELCYTGTNPKTGQIHTVSISRRYMHTPYALALKEDYIYWGDEWKGAVYRINKTSTGNVQRLVSRIDPIDLHVYHNNSAVLDDNHPCAQFNGWCTHLCLLKPGGYTCVCPGKTGSRPCHTTPVIPTPPPTTSMSHPSPSRTVSPSRSTLQRLDKSSLSFLSSSVYGADDKATTHDFQLLSTSQTSILPSTRLVRETTRLLSDHSTVLLTSSYHYTTTIAPSTPARLQAQSTVESSMVVSTRPYLTSSLPSMVSSSSSSSSHIFSSSAVETPALSSIHSSSSNVKSTSSSKSMPPQDVVTSLSAFSTSFTSSSSSSPFHSSSNMLQFSSPIPFTSVHQISSMPPRSLFSSKLYALSSNPSSSSVEPAITPVIPYLPVFTSTHSLFSSISTYIPSTFILKSTARHVISSSSSVSTTFPSSALSTINIISTTRPSSELPTTDIISTTRPSSELPTTNIISTTRPSSALPTTNIISTTRPSSALPTTNIISTTRPSSTSPPINKCQPECQVGEKCIEPWHKCLQIGENKVSLLFKMNEIQWSNNTFKTSVSRASAEYCTKEPCLELLRPAKSSKRKKRSSPKRKMIFSVFDVLILNDPIPQPNSDETLVVLAVLVPLNYESQTVLSRTRRVIAKQNLCKLIWQARNLINEYMKGPRILKLDGQTPPSCVSLGGGKTRAQGDNDSKEGAATISVSVLGVVLLVALLFVAVFYFRRRKIRKNVPQPYQTQISFNNRGFIENDNDYESVDGSFSNPAYAEIDQVLNNKVETCKPKKLLNTPSVEPVKEKNINRDHRFVKNVNEFSTSGHSARPRPRRTGNEVVINPSNLSACADVEYRRRKGLESGEYSTPIPVIPRYMPISSNLATKSRDREYAHLNPGTRKRPSLDHRRKKTSHEGHRIHDNASLVHSTTRTQRNDFRWTGSMDTGSVEDGYDHLWRNEPFRPSGSRDDNIYDHLQRGFSPRHNTHALQLEQEEEVVEETII